MSLAGDHLRDDTCRGMHSPDPEPKVAEAMRLASLLARARVRKYAKANGLAPMETEAGLRRNVERATYALRDYLRKNFQE